ncbi:MAG: sensor histidine kinase [Akkermansiaceae bacterium]
MRPATILILLLLLFQLTMAEETKPPMESTWEHAAAFRFSKEYRNNSDRLKAISTQLNQLPTPYKGEPTASGGFLSHWLDSPEESVTISFRWPKPHQINAVSLLPLRLYLGKAGRLTENAYWPGKIEIKARSISDGQMRTITTLENTQLSILRSLPEIVNFESVNTNQIEITCTNLTKETSTPHYGAGFSEIFIFSDQDNLAPLAEVKTSPCREDKIVFSATYLTDVQTPLGLPELGPATPKGLGIYYQASSQILRKPYICEITFQENTDLDAVRLDPAIIHRPGQSFPVKFKIELLNTNNEVIGISDTYQHTTFTNPGLNPYIAHFAQTTVSGIRITVFEVSIPANKSHAIIQLSEITPMLHGIPIKPAANFNRSTVTPERLSQKFEDSDDRLNWTLPSVYDGMTHTGKVISHFEWVTKLALRQELLEEQQLLKLRQLEISQVSRATTTWSVSFLTLAIIAIATYITLRSRRRAKEQVQQMRERIASDLHDETGSSLAAIALHAGQLLSKNTNPSELTSLNAILRLSKESVFGLREVLHTTAPRVGREQDILAYMREVTGFILVDKEYTFDSTDFSSIKDISNPLIRRDLILFYKEALINSQKNSQCTAVNISISNKLSKLILVVDDNGVGMTPDQLARPRALRTLKQRADRLNGHLSINTEPGKGLRLVLTAPLHANN